MRRLLPFLLLLASLGPMRAAAQEARGRVIFEDDMVSRHNWQEGVSFPCRKAYGDGGLIIEHTHKGVTCEVDLLLPGALPEKVRIEVTVKLRKGSKRSDYGLKFGAVLGQSSTYYTFGLDAEGRYQLAAWDGKSWAFLLKRTKDAAVRSGYGAANQIAVEVAGRTIRCFVNGKSVGEAAAPIPAAGYMGFTLDEGGMEAVFSKLRITELPAAAP